jgi:hypothetical protein
MSAFRTRRLNFILEDWYSMAELTTGDLALMKDDGLGGSNSFMWIFALLILMFGGGGAFGFGGRGPVPAGADQVNQGFTNQQLQQIALSSANNNYETAQLVNAQTNALMQQNNTNLVNAIQGFNQVNLGLQNQTNVLAQQIQALQAKLDSCCCEIKTQMLQNRYEDERANNVALRNDISNYNQTQFILGQTGRWVGWATSGTPATTTGT